MMVLVTGGSGSGKSAYAEEYVEMLSTDCKKYYIATMQVYGREGKEKVCRHQKLRAGKGFFTIEQPKDIHEAAKKMQAKNGTERIALLECMSNLTANEMFGEEELKACEVVTKKIIREIELLNNSVKHLVIVSNNVFEDGITYDKTTMDYICAMGRINQKLAQMADRVIEVVVGIPVVMKEGN